MEWISLFLLQPYLESCAHLYLGLFPSIKKFYSVASVDKGDYVRFKIGNGEKLSYSLAVGLAMLLPPQHRALPGLGAVRRPG